MFPTHKGLCNKLYHGGSGNRKLLFNVPYTLWSAQYTIVIQEIGILFLMLATN